MAFDLARARQDTPGCAHMIHFNNAGAALMPRPVLEAAMAHLQLESEIGGYAAAARRKEAIEHFYDTAATLINCSRDEIAYAENATRAWDMAFYAIPFKAGDRILTSMAEYASNYISYLQVMRRTGVVVEPIPDDAYGQIDLEILRQRIDERVKLISVTHIPTSGGLINPVVEVGKIARAANILYLIDACQSVGHVPIDVQEIGCDMLSTTGRKYLRGPRGTGFLYVRREVLEQLEPPFLDLHAAKWVAPDRYEIRKDARRFECWESNIAGLLGLAAAMDYAQSWGIKQTWRRIKDLAYYLRSQLSPLPGVIIHDRGIHQCGIVTFTIDGTVPANIQTLLADQNINISIVEQSSTLLDLQARKLEQLIRASVHYYNSEEEIDHFCAAIAQLTE